MAQQGWLSKSWLGQTVVGNVVWFGITAILAVAIGVLKLNESALVEPVGYTLGAFLVVSANLLCLRLPSVLRREHADGFKPENSEETILKWAQDAMLQVKKEPIAECIWRFVISSAISGNCAVCRLKDSPAYISLVGNVIPEERDQAVLHSLTAGQMKILAARVGLDLARSGIGHVIEKKPFRVIMSVRVPISATLGEAVFLQAVERYFLGQVAAVFSFRLNLWELTGKE